MAENITKIFHQEVYEKKRTGRGVYGRASRSKGFKGSVKFPADLLKKKEKKDYTKPSEVKIFNMNKITSIKDIMALPPDIGKEKFKELIEEFTNKELVEKLDASMYEIHKTQKHFNTFRESRSSHAIRARKENSKRVLASALDKPFNPFLFTLAGYGEGEDLQEQIKSLGGMIRDSKKYSINITIKEEIS